MVSHFSTIGLTASSQQSFENLLLELGSKSQSLTCDGGKYLRWSDPSGAELWIQVDRRGDILGVRPHFVGKSNVRVRLEERIVRPDASKFDGAFIARADPTEGDPESGSYPFVFDSPDYRLNDQVDMNSLTNLQVAAFAHEVSLFDTEGAYKASPSGHVFASRSFCPSGLFSPDGKTHPPRAQADLAGYILETSIKTNERTGERFYWVLVDSSGGIFDVVIANELLTSAPKVGGVLDGSFWLSGRMKSAGEYSCDSCGNDIIFGQSVCPSCGEHLDYS